MIEIKDEILIEMPENDENSITVLKESMYWHYIYNLEQLINILQSKYIQFNDDKTIRPIKLDIEMTDAFLGGVSTWEWMDRSYENNVALPVVVWINLNQFTVNNTPSI